jgi:putative endonuclease
VAFLIMFYIYIIYSSKLDRYYVGYTSDIEARLVQHNSGISSYTSKANDWKHMYQEQFTSREEAHKREVENQLFQTFSYT